MIVDLLFLVILWLRNFDIDLAGRKISQLPLDRGSFPLGIYVRKLSCLLVAKVVLLDSAVPVVEPRAVGAEVDKSLFERNA